MIRRCHEPRARDFARYGGRGITVCARWRDSLAAFIADMGARPLGQTVERIDNDLGYSPANCRWASRKEQARNTSQNVFLTFNGETLVLSDWAERAGLSRRRLAERLRCGWSLDRALTAPLARLGPPRGTDVNQHRRAQTASDRGAA